jgi:DNA-binding transcriptional LysR family regulator
MMISADPYTSSFPQGGAGSSEHVKDLEERLGARLPNRTMRQVSLTETGRAYYERCMRLLADS